MCGQDSMKTYCRSSVVRWCVLLSAVLHLDCKSPSVSSDGATPSSPTGGPPPVNIAGTWTGTFASSNFVARTISLNVVQSGSCVDGAWATSPSEWSGAISGYADATSFSGFFSIEIAAGQCTGVGTVSGEVGAKTLQWTG